MKKLLALILALSMLFVFTACGEDENNSSYSDTQPSTTQQEETTTYKEENTTEAVVHTYISASQLGFNYLEEMGYGFFQITGYNLLEGYATYRGDYPPYIAKFENNYVIELEFDIESNTLQYTGTAEYYEVVNNDIFNVPGDGEFIINDRKTFSAYPKFVTFIRHRYRDRYDWYIPFSIIDWDKGVEEYIDPNEDYDYEYSYKIHLKDMK